MLAKATPFRNYHEFASTEALGPEETPLGSALVLSFQSVGSCMDKIIQAAANEVLSAKIGSSAIARYGIVSVEADLWMVNPTYKVTLMGSTADSKRIEKKFMFGAQPATDCKFNLVPLE